jgi:hypothetical protein
MRQIEGLFPFWDADFLSDEKLEPGECSELQPCLKCDHSWTAIAAQTDAQ